MVARRGDRISVESERVGKPPREGEIVQIHETAAGTSYLVRWDDGHESSIHPAAGSARILPANKAPTA